MAKQRSMKRLLILTTLAGALFAGCSSAAMAQATATRMSADMQPLFATPMDIADGKQLASMSCVRCHGADGIGSAANTPHIAGQRPAYLYLALEAYKSGDRKAGKVHDALKFLSKDALVKVAAYYAGLDPAPVPGGPATPAKPDALQAGKAAAAACTGCHGNTGVTQIPGTPSLAGLYPKYLVEAMQDYKNGKRKNETMKAMLTAVDDKAIADIALFFALQKPARTKTPAAGDKAAGKAAAASCGGCHGEDGVSSSPATPSLAGQDAAYIAAALHDYKNGKRAHETMKGMAAGLDGAAMKNLGAYYAAQEPKAPNVHKPMTTAEWVSRCNRCHGINGNSTDPRIPMLASQRADYLKTALHEYRTQKRRSSAMAPMAEGLKEADIENLATYYAHQKARAVLFVPLSGK